MVNKLKQKKDNRAENKLTVAIQALDNQYVPESLMIKMQKNGWGKSHPGIQKAIIREARKEFKRGLLYSEEIDINRAFLVNTPALYQEFSRKSKSRESLNELIAQKAIRPWLWDEKSLKEFLQRNETFHRNPEGVEAIKQFLGDFGSIECIKLSEDEKENLKKAGIMSDQLAHYFQRSEEVCEKVARDLSARDNTLLRNRLTLIKDKVTNHVENEGPISRDYLYKNFVCALGTNTDEGIYDFSIPCMREVKYLADLKYSANFADALGIQTFTPRELPTRLALHEMDILLNEHPRGFPINLRVFLEQAIHLFLSPAYWLESLDYLSMKDILDIRQMDEYHAFIESIKSIQMPEKIIEQGGDTQPVDLGQFQTRLKAYQQIIANTCAIKRTVEVKPWVKLIVDIGGNLINIGLDDYCVQVIDDTFGISDKISSAAVTAIISSSVNNDLECSFNLLNSHIENAQEQFVHLVEMLKRKGFSIDKKITQRMIVDEEGTISESEFEELY